MAWLIRKVRGPLWGGDISLVHLANIRGPQRWGAPRGSGDQAWGPKEELAGEAAPWSGHMLGEGPPQAGMKTPRFQGAMLAHPIFLQMFPLGGQGHDKGVAGASWAGLRSPATRGSPGVVCPPPPPSQAHGRARGCKEPFHQRLLPHPLSSQAAHEGHSHSPLSRCWSWSSRGWEAHPQPSRQ